MDKRQSVSTLMPITVLVLWWLIISPAVLACPNNDGSRCKDCIAKQMKCGRPLCAPMLRCVAQCLWGGTSKPDCVKRCDCGRAKPNLSACKKCMSKCKCICMVY